MTDCVLARYCMAQLVTWLSVLCLKHSQMTHE